MENRPIIKLELTTIDRMLEIIGSTFVLVIWIITLTNYFKLPEIIPIHFNAAGEADGFGNKTNIFLFPVIATIIYAGLTIINRYPHLFNFPTKITEENAMRQYIIATQMVRYLKLMVVVIFGFIVFKTVQNANGQAVGIGSWFLLISLGIIFIPMIYSIIKLSR